MDAADASLRQTTHNPRLVLSLTRPLSVCSVCHTAQTQPCAPPSSQLQPQQHSPHPHSLKRPQTSRRPSVRSHPAPSPPLARADTRLHTQTGVSPLSSSSTRMTTVMRAGTSSLPLVSSRASLAPPHALTHTPIAPDRTPSLDRRTLPWCALSLKLSYTSHSALTFEHAPFNQHRLISSHLKSTDESSVMRQACSRWRRTRTTLRPSARRLSTKRL